MGTPKSRPQRRPNTKRRTLADQLRDAIVASGRTDHAIATAAGLDPSSVGRFMRDERSWTLAIAERVAAVLGLNFTGAATPTRTRTRPQLEVVRPDPDDEPGPGMPG